jgi:hypothetical protein
VRRLGSELKLNFVAQQTTTRAGLDLTENSQAENNADQLTDRQRVNRVAMDNGKL